MVKGLDRFRSYFAPFKEYYVLIGGTACFLSMEEVGLEFRATKDLDIVLCVEVLNKEFVEVFWRFIRDGGYHHRQKSTGKELFYRFHSPVHSDYPEMIELFSRKPNEIILKGESHLTPISVEEEVSSLSAILLNDDYYRFIHEGKREIEDLAVIAPEHIIPLKARAFLDLSERRVAGGKVDEKDIRKHKNDILRLYQVLSLNNRITLPKSVQLDMQKFIERLREEIPVDIKHMGLKNISFKELLEDLILLYNLRI